MRLAALLLAAPLALQGFGNLAEPPRKLIQYVTYASEQQTVAAGKPSEVELHFQVRQGYHINSHQPKDELLLVTYLDLNPTPGVKLATVTYPAGQPFHLPVNPPETLDVYAGDFTLKLPLTANPGAHEVTGLLHYQACDHAACYPPRTLPVSVVFTAR